MNYILPQVLHQEKPQLLIHSYKLEYARVSAKSADLN